MSMHRDQMTDLNIGQTISEQRLLYGSDQRPRRRAGEESNASREARGRKSRTSEASEEIRRKRGIKTLDV